MLQDRRIVKLLDIRLPFTTCRWIRDFFSDRVQRVRGLIFPHPVPQYHQDKRAGSRLKKEEVHATAHQHQRQVHVKGIQWASARGRELTQPGCLLSYRVWGFTEC